MTREKFENVTVLVADRDPRARIAAKRTLVEAGFRHILTGQSLEFVRESFSVDMPELLIAETDLVDGSLIDFIHDVRHHRVGTNPFLVISALTDNPTPELVRNVIQSGADDLLSKPFDVKTLLRRIGRLIHERKPFIVTGDYVGPARKPKSHKEAHADQFQAPNTLKARALGEGNADEVQAMVDAAIRVTNGKALEAHADDIEELVETIVPRLRKGRVDTTAQLCLDRLRYAAEDATRRLGESQYQHVSDLTAVLLYVVNSVMSSAGSPKPTDVLLLPPLNQAIQLGFDPKADVATARQISQAILAKL